MDNKVKKKKKTDEKANNKGEYCMTYTELQVSTSRTLHEMQMQFRRGFPLLLQLWSGQENPFLLVAFS